MRFKINDSHWEIKELDTKELTQKVGGDENEFLFGFCSYTEKIYLKQMF